jgi:hypothetical protein
MKKRKWTCFWSLLNDKDKDWVKLALDLPLKVRI